MGHNGEFYFSMGQGTIDCAQYENDLPFDIMSLNLFKVWAFPFSHSRVCSTHFVSYQKCCVFAIAD